ncbi:unnamed protein product [Owenia fusiformis]|uniref:Uncharacterized protein n=1 Tax=Owenia fusiformis TaxID=6347 RepID=A0A8J1UHA5_OWEFU|nr:unnamed protein product [Owenia fusiformis]
MAESVGVKKVCELCLKATSQYTCPRCNIRYCTSVCYKGESHANCSEAFYKDCFMEALKEKEVNEEDKKQMIETLKKYEDDPYDLDSDEEELSLEERMSGLDLDNDSDEIWSALTDVEKKEFQAMLQDGRLGHLVELWEPWWTSHNAALVTEVGKKIQPPKGQLQILTKIPEIGLLLKNPPSENIKYGVLNILYGYCYLLRLHNGEQAADSAIQFCQDLKEISDCLGDMVYSLTSEALQIAIENISGKAKSVFVSQEFSISIIEDVKHVIIGPDTSSSIDYVLAALSDIYRNFVSARKMVNNELKNVTKPEEQAALKEMKKGFFKIGKGVEFKLAWAKSYGAMMQSLIPELELELCSLTSEFATQSKVNKYFEKKLKAKPKKPLIEEL